MKKTLLILASAVLFASTLIVPSVVRADGGGGSGTNCNGTLCKP